MNKKISSIDKSMETIGCFAFTITRTDGDTSEGFYTLEISDELL